MEIAVIGLGRFGAALVADLNEREATIIGIDVDPKVAHEIDSTGDRLKVLDIDATDGDAMKSAGVDEQLDVAVVAIGEAFEATQLVVLRLKDLGVKRIVARAQTDDRRRILERMGVNEVISPETESARRVGFRMTHPLHLDRSDDALELEKGIDLVTLPVPERLIGKTVSESGAGASHNVLIIRLRRRDRGEALVPPPADAVFSPKDELTVVGAREDVSQFFQ